MRIIKRADKNKEAQLVTPKNNIYVSQLVLVDGEFALPINATSFGYIFDGELSYSGRVFVAGDFFSFPAIEGQDNKIVATGRAILFIRYGFLGQQIQGVVEDEGRVQYIDGCTDSVLVSPPRLGDACLNSLHFPTGITQTVHTHPTVRLGVVAKGSGIATTIKDGQLVDTLLEAGDAFILEANEAHRFKTLGEKMLVVAYHPDSDYGPTDEFHPMKNRTYL